MTTKKLCPKCDTEHEKHGAFCSRKCANSRQWTDAHKKVFSERQSAYMASDKSEGHRAKRAIQTAMLVKAGIMGKGTNKESPEDVMRNPDDYYLLPMQYMDLDVEDGAVWEDI